MKYVIGAVVVVLVIVGAVVAFSGDRGARDTDMMEKEGMMSSSTGEMMEKEGMMSSSTGEMMEKGDAMMEKSGSYESYAADKVAAAAASGDAVLFFRASWCPTCRALDADIRAQRDDIPAGLTIFDVDYDNSTALRQRYGVTRQHTLVQVNAQGDLVKKWDGTPTLAALVTQVN